MVSLSELLKVNILESTRKKVSGIYGIYSKNKSRKK